MNSRWYCLFLFMAGIFQGAQAKNYTFDVGMLGDAAKDVDMSLLNSGLQQPGTYLLDIMLNGTHIDTRDVELRLDKNSQGEPSLLPCLTVSQLSRYGIKTEDYPELEVTASCVNIQAIPQAEAIADLNNLQVRLSIPQEALRPTYSGLAAETLWNDGIPALLMNYQAGVTQGEYRSGTIERKTSSWIQLQPGFNLGAWRVRNSLYWRKNSGKTGKWQKAYTYAEYGLYRMKSRLDLGEKTSSSEIFDSVPFLGVMLSSDEQMVPSSQRQFSPVIRGIARTQARVEVKQHGYTIYNTTVSPGPFALEDLSMVDDGGDLDVTVWETDGSPQIFTVAYQIPAIALHQGYLKYSLMTGRYRPADSSIRKTQVTQATLMYGLPWNLTGYGGIQNAANYQSAALGIGISLGQWGSVSLDATGARSRRRGAPTQRGGTWRFRYSNLLAATNTNFSLASWQYASPGYSALEEVLDTYNRHEETGDNLRSSGRQQRSRITLSLGQPWGKFGNTNLNYSRTYWRNNPGHDESYGFSWQTSIARVSLSLSINRDEKMSRNGTSHKDTTTSLWLSMPLDSLTGSPVNASWQMTLPSSGGGTQEAGLDGRAFDQRLYWNIRQRYQDNSQGDRNNSSLDLLWDDTYGQLGASYSYSPTMRQAGANVAGAILLHHDGITLGQPLEGGQTALIKAPGVKGVPVGYWPGVKTDFRGYTTLGGLSAYQENIVSLDPTMVSDDVEILQTDAKVIPTQGAIVMAEFKVRSGAKALFDLTQPDGEKIPFGARITVNGYQDSAGIMDTNGQAYLSGLPEQGALIVQWGSQQCVVNFRLPAEKAPSGLYQMKGLCQ